MLKVRKQDHLGKLRDLRLYTHADHLVARPVAASTINIAGPPLGNMRLPAVAYLESTLPPRRLTALFVRHARVLGEPHSMV